MVIASKTIPRINPPDRHSGGSYPTICLRANTDGIVYRDIVEVISVVFLTFVCDRTMSVSSHETLILSSTI